jgi:hypothetical protein
MPPTHRSWAHAPIVSPPLGEGIPCAWEKIHEHKKCGKLKDYFHLFPSFGEQRLKKDKDT